MLADDLVEARLRRHFADSLEPSGDLVAEVLAGRRPHAVRRSATMRLSVAAVAALATVAGIAALLGVVLSPGAPSTGRPSLGPHHLDAPNVLALATYEFRLPKDYRLTSALHTTCRAIVTIGGPSAAGVSALSPDSTAASASAAASSGGCISMLLTPPFTPSSTTPAPYLRSGGQATSSPVRVGPYSGWLTTQGALTRWLQSQGVVPASTLHPDLQLSVELPLGGGEYRVLEVGSRGISQSALVDIVRQGLSS